MALVVVCPVCRADIPMPVTGGHVTQEGLSSVVDTSYGEEHLQMHQKCSCIWVEGERVHTLHCLVHA